MAGEIEDECQDMYDVRVGASNVDPEAEDGHERSEQGCEIDS